MNNLENAQFTQKTGEIKKETNQHNCYGLTDLASKLSKGDLNDFSKVPVGDLKKFIRLTLLKNDPNGWEKIVARNISQPTLDTDFHVAQGLGLGNSEDFEYDPNGNHFGVPKGISLQHAITRLLIIDPDRCKTFLSELDSNQIVKKAFDGNPIDTSGAGNLTLGDILYELNIEI